MRDSTHRARRDKLLCFMEYITSMFEMLSDKCNIVVPQYQRAYSWGTDLSEANAKQVNTFLSDLDNVIKCRTSESYYLGHFLFEEMEDGSFAVIDGQQRLTTTIICLAALYRRLMKLKNVDRIDRLEPKFQLVYENCVKYKYDYRFSTVDYDDQMFRDYVIDQKSRNRERLDTLSQRRIADAFDFFCKKFEERAEEQVKQLILTLSNATCTAHEVTGEGEAAQMFIFQNNRGKKPTKLEIIKAQLLYHVYLYAEEGRKESILEELSNRFKEIYQSIAHVEQKVSEDQLLDYAICVRQNRLSGEPSMSYVESALRKPDAMDFIVEFARFLAECFVAVKMFFFEEKSNDTYHALWQSADKNIMFPFMIKATLNGMTAEREKLAIALDQIFLRHRIVGTRASLESRLKDVFKDMTDSAKSVVGRINWMKTASHWWGHWNNDEVERKLNMGLHHNTAKLLLWKYENYLHKSGQPGYDISVRFEAIPRPHLEHIAPQTENESLANGYERYDDEFREQYLDSLGNYLLLSGTHNIVLGNKPFAEKRETYSHLRQQQEVRAMTEGDHLWDREKIRARQKKIVDAIKEMI